MYFLLRAIFLLVFFAQSCSYISTANNAPPKTVNLRSRITVILSTILDFDISITERTTSCLDFNVILEYLENQSITVLGRNLAQNSNYDEIVDIKRAYQMVEELSFHLDYIPLRSPMDILSVLRSIEIGAALERESLAEFAATIEEINELKRYLDENVETLTLFTNHSANMSLPESLTNLFHQAFDEENNLNGKKFPIIGTLRRSVDSLRSRILNTIQSVIRSPAMKEKIADRYSPTDHT